MTFGRELVRITTPAQWQQLQRFWYRIYVEEMGRHQDDADHEARELTDSYARGGRPFAMMENGEIIGSLVILLCGSDRHDKYAELYDLEDRPWWELQRSAIITKLMVAPEHRKGPLAVDLALAAYRFGIRHDVNYCYIDCNSYLVPFFTALGFRPWRDRVEHVDYGRVSVMRFDLNDHDHLIEINSPFRALIEDARKQHIPNDTETALNERYQ